MAKEALYKFYWDCGRNGCVEGVFIADKKDVEEATGRRVYFGEILGKHSEVQGTIDEGDIKMITDDKKVIEIIREHLGGGIGYDPFEYICCEHGVPDYDECPECEEGEEAA